MTREELRDALRQLPPTELGPLLRDVLRDHAGVPEIRKVLADLVESGVLQPAIARPYEVASDEEARAAARAFIDQYKPALERLAKR